MCYTSSCDCCRDQGQEKISQQWFCHSILEISSGKTSAQTIHHKPRCRTSTKAQLYQSLVSLEHKHPENIGWGTVFLIECSPKSSGRKCDTGAQTGLVPSAQTPLSLWAVQPDESYIKREIRQEIYPWTFGGGRGKLSSSKVIVLFLPYT